MRAIASATTGLFPGVSATTALRSSSLNEPRADIDDADVHGRSAASNFGGETHAKNTIEVRAVARIFTSMFSSAKPRTRSSNSAEFDKLDWPIQGRSSSVLLGPKRTFLNRGKEDILI